MTIVYRRSKTLRCRTNRCNCKWIDSLETPVYRGPKVQHTDRMNLSGNRTEKNILTFYLKVSDAVLHLFQEF